MNNSLLFYLIKDGLLEANQVSAITQSVLEKKITLNQYLLSAGLLTAKKILACCLKHFNLPIANSQQLTALSFQSPLINPELIYHYRIVPIEICQQTLLIAVSDPTDHISFNSLSLLTGFKISLVLLDEEQLTKIIKEYDHLHHLETQLEQTIADTVNENSIDIPLEENTDPVTDFVNALLQNAVNNKISDIHIEPSAKNYRIRFRRDGILYQAAIIPIYLGIRIISRFKLLTNLNIAERRLPQDGHMKLANHQLDIRISTCPTLYGEKIVLRLLNAHSLSLHMQDLGLNENQLKTFVSKLQQTQGLIIVTGPTGSGKTITLYTALQYLNQLEKNIASVEDPVEIELPGINQVSINPSIGLSFEKILRAFLRQDPDILMLGEMRDLESANLAMHAAQTGHLVLSTLHANNALETLTRLRTMGIPAYQLINSITLIIAQRLLRKLCLYCRPKQTGCEHCFQGYSGRIGIFELLIMTPKLAKSINNFKNPLTDISYMNLAEAGLEKVQLGITNHLELIRVLGHVED